MVSFIKLRSFGWAERTGTHGKHLPSIAVCVGDVEAFWVGQSHWHTPENQSSSARFLEQLALLTLGFWQVNRTGTRLKNTYWALVVTRPASHDLAPQAACQWGKLFRVMILLSFMMCGMKPF